MPLAAGHELAAAHRPAAAPSAPAPAAAAPFGQDAPEANFSLVDLCDTAPAAPVAPMRPRADLEQPVRAMPPSFREIRAGRAAAASRTPIAEVRIPVAEVAGVTETLPPAQGVLPCMDGLVERVRQRTAARLSRAASLGSH